MPGTRRAGKRFRQFGAALKLKRRLECAEANAKPANEIPDKSESNSIEIRQWPEHLILIDVPYSPVLKRTIECRAWPPSLETVGVTDDKPSIAAIPKDDPRLAAYYPDHPHTSSSILEN